MLFSWCRAEFLLAIWGKLMVGAASPQHKTARPLKIFSDIIIISGFQIARHPYGFKKIMQNYRGVSLSSRKLMYLAER